MVNPLQMSMFSLTWKLVHPLLQCYTQKKADCCVVCKRVGPIHTALKSRLNPPELLAPRNRSLNRRRKQTQLRGRSRSHRKKPDEPRNHSVIPAPSTSTPNDQKKGEAQTSSDEWVELDKEYVDELLREFENNKNKNKTDSCDVCKSVEPIREYLRCRPRPGTTAARSHSAGRGKRSRSHSAGPEKKANEPESPSSSPEKQRSKTESPSSSTGKKRSKPESPSSSSGKKRIKPESPSSSTGKKRRKPESPSSSTGNKRSKPENPSSSTGKKRSKPDIPSSSTGKKQKRTQSNVTAASCSRNLSKKNEEKKLQVRRSSGREDLQKARKKLEDKEANIDWKYAEPDRSRDHYLQGHMVWARLRGHVFWPAVVCNGIESTDAKFCYRYVKNGASTHKTEQYHVQFFDEEKKRGWISNPLMLIDYKGRDGMKQTAENAMKDPPSRCIQDQRAKAYAPYLTGGPLEGEYKGKDEYLEIAEKAYTRYKDVPAERVSVYVLRDGYPEEEDSS